MVKVTSSTRILTPAFDNLRSFTDEERRSIHNLQDVPKSVIQFESDPLGHEWASIGASSGDFTLLHLVRISAGQSGFWINDGSSKGPLIYTSIGEAVFSVRKIVAARMAAFGFIEYKSDE